MNYLLWALHEDRPVEAVFLRTGKTVEVGRSRQCDLRFQDPYISRLHIEARYDGHSVRARNECNSGFRIEGRHCNREVELQPGDVIRLGLGKGPPHLRLDVAPVVDAAWLAWQNGTVPRLARSA
jgi:FHA domain-containing protein